MKTNKKLIENAQDFFAELEKLNPDLSEGDLVLDDRDASNVKIVIKPTIKNLELTLPDGFAYNQKNGFTNKHSTKNGQYISIPLSRTPKSIQQGIEKE